MAKLTYKVFNHLLNVIVLQKWQSHYHNGERRFYDPIRKAAKQFGVVDDKLTIYPLDILLQVCIYCNVSSKDVMSKSRYKDVCEARDIFMYIADYRLPYWCGSRKQIAEIVGLKSSQSVNCAVKRVMEKFNSNHDCTVLTFSNINKNLINLGW